MFFAGLAQGFSQAQTQDRQLQAQIDEQNANREQSTLLHLATTHPDPEVRSSALATMLTPRTSGQSGIGRFFNQAKTNPMMPTLMQLMGSQRAEPVMGQQAPPPPDTAGGVPLERDVAPSQPVQIGTRMVSRGAPPTSAQVAGQTEEAQAAGKIIGTSKGADIAFPSTPAAATPPPTAPAPAPAADGTTPSVAAPPPGAGTSASPSPDQVEKNKRYLKYKALGFPQTVTYDPQGNMHVVMGGEDFGGPTGVHTVQRGPEADIASQIKNLMARDPNLTWHEADTQARSLAASTTEAKQATTITGASTAGYRNVTAGVTAANASTMAATRLAKMRQEILDDQTAQRGTSLSNELKQRTLNGQLTEVEAYRVLSPLWSRPGMTSDVFNEYLDSVTGGGKVGGGVGGGAGAPSAAPPPAGQPAPPAAARTPTASAPPTSATSAPPRPAVTTPSARPQRGGLPPGRSLYKPDAQEQSTLDTITAARPMMQSVRQLIVGKEGDNSLRAKGKGVIQAAEGWAGFNPSDPMYQQLDPLIQHLKVFANSPYLHGIRNGAFVKQVQDNTPSVTDTPARISAKLDNLEKNFTMIEQGVGAQKDGTKSAAAPPAPPAAPVPPEVQQALKGMSAGKHTLSDGSVWTIGTDGGITQAR